MEPEIITEAQTWLVNNQGLLIEYAVNIAAALITLLVGYIAANLLSNGVTKVMHARKLDATVVHFVGSILKYTILVFVVIAAMGRVGVQTASFVAIIGAAGLAIGLALQGSLSNFAAGFLLITSAPSKPVSLSKWRAPMVSCSRCSYSLPPSPRVTTRWWWYPTPPSSTAP